MLGHQEVGDGVPVVLVPMFGLDRRSMVVAFEPVLSGRGLRRIFVDLPGIGGSAPVEPSSDAMLDALIEFVDGIGEPVHLVGASFGGYLAIGLARRRPELVRSLLLVASGTRILVADRAVPTEEPETPEPDWLDGVPPDLHEHLDKAVSQRTKEVAGRVAGLIGDTRADEEYLERVRSTAYQLSDEGTPHVFPGPVLMVTGRADRVAGYEDQLRAMAAYPNGTYVALPGAGHYLPYERPDLFAAVVRGWLDVASGV